MKFSLEEMFCPHIVERFGEAAWNYLDIRLMETIAWIRRTLNKPMTVNSKRLGYTQRGMRCNCCQLVNEKKQAYLSAHIFGQAVDFDVQGMTNKEVHDWLEEHKTELPHKIRLERASKSCTWVHLDVRNESADKIVYFNG